MASPLNTSSVALQLELILTSLAALEPKNTTVLADKHHTGTGLNFFAREVARLVNNYENLLEYLDFFKDCIIFPGIDPIYVLL